MNRGGDARMTQPVAGSATGSRGVLVRLFSVGDLVPRHGVLDGTWIVSLFFPLYFGFFLGDVGYGVVMLVAVLAARFAWGSSARVRLVAEVLGRAAALSIGFGLLYGEFFGRSFGPTPLNRVETAQGLGIAALTVIGAQLLANVGVGVLGSRGPRRREDAWAPASDFTVFIVVILAVFAAIQGTVAIIEAVAGWLVGSGEVPNWTVSIIWYVVWSAAAAGAALLADLAFKRFRASAAELG